MTRAGSTGPEGTWPEALLTSLGKMPSCSGLYVALSGGLDSVLLLHTASRLFGHRGRLNAIHVNHQLQPNAPETERFCQQLCQSLAIHCHVVRVTVPVSAADERARTGGLEEAARAARYEAFESHLGKGDLLLMAHHGDDQVETVLFRLLRGSGVAGLAGMPVSRPMGKAAVYRPFLDFSRRELEAWAKELSIQWLEDPSNLDRRFDRNFLRQAIIPALRERWPFLNRRVAATAKACREGDELAASLARIHFDQCRTDDDGLDISALKNLTLAEQKNLIRWWVSQQGFLPPETGDWQALLSGFMDSRDDRQPEYSGTGYRLRRHQNALYFVIDRPAMADQPRPLEPGKPVNWGGWHLSLEPAAPEPRYTPKLVVHARQGGERIRVRPGGPSRPLKKWLQEQSVPAWERGRLPLVSDSLGGDETLVAAGHLWVSEQYCGEAPSSGWRLILERDSD
ncbi:tRNA lysidine(34) synthetase TilS [Marinobacter confluentis]|uniref:tRNA(Ile)-lysidine synthase n=1 Tax=Marinobacter confluentis TaxID=1697557 RepID=A0A4Z1CCJ9_9GAMM|nr:tRNA lysidine(34) synthetase TilS [Marinobacter confluentis]TGN41966.1 tRNA lysidine(34) synthetase TilS [Marinobacter confluentis]